MSYTSPRLPNAKPMGSATIPATPNGMARGFQARSYAAQPLGCFGAPWTQIISPDERLERVKQLDELGVTNRDLKRERGITSLNQGQTNYCWTNAPVQALHYLQARSGPTIKRFSPASVGSYIKNFRNVGGWGNESLERLISDGVNEVGDWPANAIDRQYATAENKEKAKRNRVTEWYDLPPRDFEALASCLVLGHTVAVGYNWWGHEVLAIDIAYIDGKEYVVIDNSWGNWGDNGLGILTRQRATPDDAVAPRVLTPRAA